jgi:opacity protein-like surface antigen
MRVSCPPAFPLFRRRPNACRPVLGGGRFAHRAILAAAAIAGLTTFPLPAAKLHAAEPAGWYGRLDLGREQGTDATFRDWNCGGGDPAAVPLYGCLARADGDYGAALAVSGGIGYRIDERFRVDLTLGWRPQFRFAGEANFPVSGGQAVRGDVSTLTGMVSGYLDLAPLLPFDLGRFEPFIGAGIGVSRNRLDGTTLAFPAIPQIVQTPGGSWTGFAWTATAGTAIRLAPRLALEVAYRYTDLGRVESDRGDATRYRTSGTIPLPIDGTRSDLASHGVSIGLRYAF